MSGQTNNRTFDTITKAYETDSSTSLSMNDAEGSMNIRKRISANCSVVTTLKKECDGYYMITRLEPPLIVPCTSSKRVLPCLNKMNEAFRKGCVFEDAMGHICFRNFIPITENDNVSDRTILIETVIGARLLLQYVSGLVDVIDGRKPSIVISEDDALRKDMSGDEKYIPDPEAISKVGDMYV